MPRLYDALFATFEPLLTNFRSYRRRCGGDWYLLRKEPYPYIDSWHRTRPIEEKSVSYIVEEEHWPTLERVGTAPAIERLRNK